MDIFYSIENLELIQIEASEEIENKSLKNFIATSLKLKDINLPKNSKVILNYVEELKLYQLILINNNSKNLEIELFYKLLEQYNQKNLVAFLYKNYFLIFKNNKLYYLQKIEENIEITELLNYLYKNFKITPENFITIKSEDLYLKKDDVLKSKNKNNLNYFNHKKNYSFFIYLFYLFFLFSIIFYLYINQNTHEPQNTEILDLKSFENDYKFNSFEEKTRKIIFKLNKQNLKLISFEFDTNILKIEITSENKDDIYKFLEDKEISFSSSSIDFVENKNIFKVDFDVKLFEWKIYLHYK